MDFRDLHDLPTITVIVNVLLFIHGAVFIGIGNRMHDHLDMAQYFDPEIYSYIMLGANVLIFIGVFPMVISVVGCISAAACSVNQRLLGIFIVFLTILLLGKLTLVIYFHFLSGYLMRTVYHL